MTTATPGSAGTGSPGQRRAGGRRRGGGGPRERALVPEATFSSYYGRPVLKAPVWEADVPGYLFLGGVAAGSSLLAAGADLTGRTALRRSSRAGALIGIGVSFGLLVHDLGKPSRFYNMLRIAKPSSPMSMGTWILTLYGPAAGIAAAAELLPLVRGRRDLLGRLARGPLGGLLGGAARPAGLGAATFAPLVASYTAVLLADTAVPSWHDGFRELPFVFVGSAAAASGGLALITTGGRDAGPARRLAVAGAVGELIAGHRMEQGMGLSAEPLHLGKAGRLNRAARALTAGGAALAVVGRRSRPLSALAGAALLAGSACTRFAVFEAGVASTKDPKYVVIPQRERVARGEAVRHDTRT